MKILKYIPFVSSELNKRDVRIKELQANIREISDKAIEKEKYDGKIKLEKDIDDFNKVFPVGAEINYLDFCAIIVKPASMQTTYGWASYSKCIAEYRRDGEIKQLEIPLSALQIAERYNIVPMQKTK